MTYVILHGTPENIEKGVFTDGATYAILFNGTRKDSWDYREYFTEHAKQALCDGNYFSEEDDGVNDDTWTEEKRNLVHDRYLELIDIIDRQLKEKGRLDIELLNYFSLDNPNNYKESVISVLKNIIHQIETDTLDASTLIDIIEALPE